MAESVRPPRPGFDAALAIVASSTPPASSEHIPLDVASGRIVNAAVRAISDYPLFDMSAMDGVAFRAADGADASSNRPILLPITAEARAGLAPPHMEEGAACRISTGAAIPTGCDTVIAREFIEIRDGALCLRRPAATGRNVRRQGEDARSGDLVLPAGGVVTPMIVGALACYGVTEVEVFRQPRITIISTGDELAGAHAIHDANGAMIAAIVQALQIGGAQRCRVGDDAVAIAEALATAAAEPGAIIVSTGGISVGDHDHLPRVVADLGGVIHFHGVAMRPGKPVMFATLPGGALYFGLPGNPVAAALGFRFLVIAAIRKMFGLPPEPGAPVSLDLPARPATTMLLKARLIPDADRPSFEILDDQRSHTMRPLITADHWVALDERGARSYPIEPLLR